MIRSSVKSACPVCTTTKHGCSWYEDRSTVMCKTYSDGTGHDGSQWYYNGVTTLGFQGKFILKTADEYVKPTRPKGCADYFYPDRNGENLVKVTRIDDGAGEKKFWQSHWDTRNWVKGNPDEVKQLIPVYRYAEIQEAIERNELIFVVEGESAADALWKLGIPATTTIGGSGGYDRYGNYQHDLKDARLILCPDRDAPGLKYMSNFDRDFSEQIEGWYLAGTAGLWKTPQGGMDIGDDITDNGCTKEQILDRIISPSEFQEIIGRSTKSDSGKSTRPHFTTNWNDGLKLVTPEVTDDEVKYHQKLIGYHLKAVAYVENPCSCGTGLLIEFRTQRGRLRQELITRSAMMGDGLEVLRLLADRGYWFDLTYKSLLSKYLFHLGDTVDLLYTISEKTGWVNGSYITPGKTYGDPNLRFREPVHDFTLTHIKGDLTGWIGEVAAKCGRNSRLIFSLGTAFAAPLLELAEIESGGFHLVGKTGIGKTTALNVAGSVAGIKNIPSWRSTSNALEGKAAEFNDGLLPLDEIGMADPQTVGASAYMLGNGQGKIRMAKTLNTIKPKTWKLLFLSTGEVDMIDYLRQAKISAKGGMEARMPSIPADGGKGFGLIEEIHGYRDSAEFVQALESSVNKHQGTAIDHYLTKLVEDRMIEGFDKELRDRVHKIARQLSQQFNDSTIGRVAVRFALVQVGLEIAHSYDLLPFPIEQCAWAVSQMFTDWVNVRGGAGSIEIKEACNKIEHLFVSNQHNADRIADPNSPQGTRNLLAYRSDDIVTEGIEYWVPLPVFDNELAHGVDKTELIAELKKRGWLKPSLDNRHRGIRRRIGGHQQWFMVFGQFWKHENTVISVISVISPPKNGSIIESQVRSGEITPENASDLSDLSTNIPEITEITPENASDLSDLNSEPILDNDLEGVRSLRSLRSLEKHVSQKNSENPALKYQRLLNGNIGTTVIKFDKHSVARDWKEFIAIVFGFYGEIEKITEEKPADKISDKKSTDKYKWKLVFDKFDRDGIDRLMSKDFTAPPQPRS